MLGVQNIASSSLAGAAAGAESEVLLLLVDIAAAALEVAVPVWSRYLAF